MSETSTHPFRSVTRDQTLSDKVADQLTEAIVSRKVSPGDRLPSERDLGVQFRVSRTVIREAVRSLAARGLVRTTVGHRVIVRGVHSDSVASSMQLLVRGHPGIDYAKVHEVRTAVEVQAAGLAAQRASPQAVARLEALCDRYELAIANRDFAAASELDYQFHRELARATENELLLAMLDSIAEVLREVRSLALARPHVAQGGLKAHRHILKYIKQGRPEATRAAMRRHLAEAARVWKALEPGRIRRRPSSK